MDETMWLEVYRTWARDALLNEIVSCHKFQRSVVVDTLNKKYTWQVAENLMLASNQREALIVEVLEEKAMEKGRLSK